VDEQYVSVLAACLYSNILQAFSANYPSSANNISALYSFIDKEALEEMIEDEETVYKINKAFMEQMMNGHKNV
jgi:hypothetical protein